MTSGTPDREGTRPIDALLGKKGEPPVCKVFSPELAIHWFPSDARTGDRCLCGQSVKGKD